MTAALALGGIGIAVAMLLIAARAALASRGRSTADQVTDAIDALLPQSQCAQCGYPGCRPYAAAVASGERLDLCPPGGAQVAERIKELLGRDQAPVVLAPPALQVARIVEADCIGCALCIDACPVDAIAGAAKYLHAVIAQDCTGCELCVPPCPVDCIELVPWSPS
jgi:electron transport complex protein RnfB